MVSRADGKLDRSMLNAVAASQSAVLSRAQLLANGATDDLIRWRLASRRWVLLHPGVYLTSPGRRDWWVGAWAALLVCGEGAVLSHASAGHPYGLVTQPPEVIDVLVPHPRAPARRPGIRVRRCSVLTARTDDGLGIPRTRIDDTALDIAATTDADGAIAVVASACRTGLTWDQGLLRALDARRGHPHGPLLRDVIRDVGDGAESVLEVRYVRDVERPHGLPVGVSQHPTGGGRRRHDRAYTAAHVLVELDGLAYHSGSRAVRRDGLRRRGSAAEGWVTVPAYWSDVAVTPCALAAEIVAVLRSRGWSGEPRRCRRAGCAL